MKKVTAVLLALLFVLGACGQKKTEEPQPTETVEKDLWAKIEEKGVLLVGTEGTYSPMTYHDESGELVGFEVEVAKAIGEKLGLKVEFVEASWEALLSGLDSGRIDTVINEVNPTEERRKKYDFSNDYTFVHGVAITKSANTDIHSFADLSGKKAAQTLASTWGQTAEANGAEIVSVTAFQESIDMILSGRADVSLNSELAFYNYIKAQPETGSQLKIAAQSEDVIVTAIPVRKGEKRFVDKMNEALAALQEAGTLKAISEKYFGKDITTK